MDVFWVVLFYFTFLSFPFTILALPKCPSDSGCQTFSPRGHFVERTICPGPIRSDVMARSGLRAIVWQIPAWSSSCQMSPTWATPRRQANRILKEIVEHESKKCRSGLPTFVQACIWFLIIKSPWILYFVSKQSNEVVLFCFNVSLLSLFDCLF